MAKFIALVTGTLTLFLSGCSGPTDDISLNVVFFTVVDATNGEPINVTLSNAGIPPLSGQLNHVCFSELNHNGPYRVTWVGTERRPGAVQISAEGYESIVVAKEIVHSTSGAYNISGFKPRVIQMKPK